MFQKVQLIGHLGKDPVMRYAPSGDPVTSFSMATSEKWNGQDGQLHEKTTWWSISVWGKRAESVNAHLHKGSKVFVEGKMQPDDKGNPRTWAAQDGSTRASFEVKASLVQFLDSKPTGSNGSTSHSAEAVPAEEEDGIPF